MVRRYYRTPVDVRTEIVRLAAKGLTYREIAERLDVSMGVLATTLKPLGGVRRADQYQPSSARLSCADRVEIALGLERGWSYRRIGDAIGRHASTVCREVNRSGGRHAYKPMTAHQHAWERTRRRKPTKLSCNGMLRQRVIDDLEQLWSPQQIAQRLRAEFGDDRSMTISHETIYKSLYVQGRGELRRELTRCLRTGRARRRPQGRQDGRGRIPDMILISERPPEVADRAVPGHWEGDLILGKNGRSAIGTLVERSTRFVMLLHLDGDHTAERVRTAMTETILTLPDALRRSVTWDRGPEMAQHVQFRIETGIPVYFCDPHSPWQRGSNENTNGLLRQYFPRSSTDFRRLSQADLDKPSAG